MSGDGFHGGWFTDDGDVGFDFLVFDFFDERFGTEASDFFIIGEGEMDGGFELELGIIGGECEGGCDESFHVACASSVEVSIFFVHGEGVCVPILVFGGDDVGVSGEEDAAVTIGSDGGE